MSLIVHEVKLIPIDALKFDPSNPNILTKEQMQGLRESFQRWGYLDPVIVDESYLVADGEHRAQIYREFGRKEIPCYVLKLSDTERRLLRQTKNKLHGEHEPKSDALELKMLYDAGELPNLSKLIAQDSEDLIRLLQKHDLVPFVEEDSIPEVEEARVKRGEIWQLGRHRLMCGSMDAEDDVKALMGGGRNLN